MSDDVFVSLNHDEVITAVCTAVWPRLGRRPAGRRGGMPAYTRMYDAQSSSPSLYVANTTLRKTLLCSH